jgi:hypothetical protein
MLLSSDHWKASGMGFIEDFTVLVPVEFLISW